MRAEKTCIVHDDTPAEMREARLGRPLYIPLCADCVRRWQGYGIDVTTPAREDGSALRPSLASAAATSSNALERVVG